MFALPWCSKVMIKFLALFFSVYGFMHVVFYSRIRGLLPRSGWFHVLLAVFFLMAITAPVLTRVFERGGHVVSARLLGSIGYIWMGFIFIAFWLSALMWFHDLIAYGVNRLTSWQVSLWGAPVPSLILLVTAVTLCLYASHEMRHVRVERVRIETDKCPRVENPFKIVQISDLHLGLQNKVERIQELITLIRGEGPALIVSTGDLVDGDFQDGALLAELFQNLHVPYGKYAVTGNHEAYAGVARAVSWTRRAGFVVLRDRCVTLPDVLNIAGVDDPVISARADADSGILPDQANGLFTLVLKHRPVIAPDSWGRFDLQLSGHTHRGQIFPFNFVVRLVYPWIEGLHLAGGGSRIYVSRGTGAWGPQMRLLAPPEITVFELVSPQ